MPRRWFIRPNAGPGQVLGAAFAKGPIKCKEGYQTVEATALEIEQVNKWYAADVHAVRDVNLAVEPGEFMIFVGLSGCGKSTLLRLVAGLERVDSGVIRMDGKSIHRVPPRDRDIAMVFQNYALYPTMKVYDNRAFPLKMRRWGREEIRARVMEVAESLGLLEYLDRRPGALSGGQCQRVALGRALVRRPRLFLMDEPLSNLDAKLRMDMRREIVSLQRDLGTTTVYVTHDQTEVMTMGSRIRRAAGRRPPAGRYAPGGVRSYLAGEGEPGAVRAIVTDVERTGRESLLFLNLPGMPVLTAAVGADCALYPGEETGVILDRGRLHFFDRETEQRL